MFSVWSNSPFCGFLFCQLAMNISRFRISREACPALLMDLNGERKIILGYNCRV
jgi:hypothetical protein